MADMTQDFVRAEFIGGPWDGQEQLMDRPFNPDVLVPLPTALSFEPEPSYAPRPRVGVYCQRGPYSWVTVAVGPHMEVEARHALAKAVPVSYHWEGEP